MVVNTRSRIMRKLVGSVDNQDSGGSLDEFLVVSRLLISIIQNNNLVRQLCSRFMLRPVLVEFRNLTVIYGENMSIFVGDVFAITFSSSL